MRGAPERLRASPQRQRNAVRQGKQAPAWPPDDPGRASARAALEDCRAVAEGRAPQPGGCPQAAAGGRRRFSRRARRPPNACEATGATSPRPGTDARRRLPEITARPDQAAPRRPEDAAKRARRRRPGDDVATGERRAAAGQGTGRSGAGRVLLSSGAARRNARGSPSPSRRALGLKPRTSGPAGPKGLARAVEMKVTRSENGRRGVRRGGPAGRGQVPMLVLEGRRELKDEVQPRGDRDRSAVAPPHHRRGRRRRHSPRAENQGQRPAPQSAPPPRRRPDPGRCPPAADRLSGSEGPPHCLVNP